MFKTTAFHHTIIFILFEIVLYSTYITLDFIGYRYLFLSDILKYSSIIICFIFTYDIHYKQANEFWLLASAFLVLFADYYLLFDNDAFPGVLIFCLVQCCYYIYISEIAKLPLYLGRAALLSALLCLLLNGWLQAPLLTFISLCYILMLINNIFLALCQAFMHKEKSHILFALGLILYALCDINVGLMNLWRIFPKQYLETFSLLQSDFFTNAATMSMWFFYLPAQVLIALSIFIRHCGTFKPERKSISRGNN